ncbi:MAG TPA: DEAD/DEAH box helicase [Caulobacteraceae bacterium]|nr:DEAD/DEAH box helicase [Caulobacteraceae bacterium]
MTVKLRPYQERAVVECRQAMRTGPTLLQLPTGGGKTITSGSIIGSASEKGNRCMFIVNRVELLRQTAKTFDKLGIRYGMIAPGYAFNSYAPVYIASVDTLKSRMTKLDDFFRTVKLAVWDECRSCGSKGWANLFRRLEELGVKQLGLDATPMRDGGKPLSEFFRHLVHGPTYSELVEVGALVPFACYAPTIPDLSGVRKKGYDFDPDAVEEVMDKPSITGSIVDNYLQHARGLKALCFAVSVEHSQHLAAEFCARGVRAVHLDGDTDDGVRKRAMQAYEAGEIDVMTNVALFVAGLDVPDIRVLIDANPTQSLPSFLQKAGRVSRPADGKDQAVLFDHAGNCFRHGVPDEDRTWSLEGIERKAKKAKDEEDEVKVRQCPKCKGVHKPRPQCPHCHHVYEIDSRQVEQRDGALRKISKEEARAIREAEKAAEKAERAKLTAEVKRTSSREGLERIARERGYSDAWVDAQLKGKAIARAKYGERQAQAQFDAYEGWKR